MLVVELLNHVLYPWCIKLGADMLSTTYSIAFAYSNSIAAAFNESG